MYLYIHIFNILTRHVFVVQNTDSFACFCLCRVLQFGCVLKFSVVYYNSKMKIENLKCKLICSTAHEHLFESAAGSNKCSGSRLIII